MAARIANAVGGNQGAAVGALNKGRGSKGGYGSAANIAAGFGNFFLGYWVLSHFGNLSLLPPSQGWRTANRSQVY